MLADFLQAVIPEPVAVLGLRLRPFCTGHLLNLYRFQSPFVSRGTVELADLMKAVMICSQDFKGGHNIFADPDLGKDLAAWEKQILAGKLNFKAERLKFANYLANGFKGPEIRYEDSNSAPTQAPGPLFTIVGLMSRFGLSFDEAVNMHLPQARWLAAGYGEQEGKLDIVDAGELEEIQKDADEYAKRIFAEQAARLAKAKEGK